MEIIKVTTWKIGSQRYLHIVETPKGRFQLITDLHLFSVWSLIIRNKVLVNKDVKGIKGLRQIREEVERLDDDEWAVLCFSGNDNFELRKKIYGKELRKVNIMMSVDPISGRVGSIKVGENGKNLIPGRSVLLRRNPRKRIKDPLPYIILQQRYADWGEKLTLRNYVVSELSLIKFNQKLVSWYR